MYSPSECPRSRHRERTHHGRDDAGRGSGRAVSRSDPLWELFGVRLSSSRGDRRRCDVFLSRLLGLRAAKTLVSMDDPIAPAEAVELGLVAEVVPASDFSDRLDVRRRVTPSAGVEVYTVCQFLRGDVGLFEPPENRLLLFDERVSGATPVAVTEQSAGLRPHHRRTRPSRRSPRRLRRERTPETCRRALPRVPTHVPPPTARVAGRPG